uniref:FAM86 domain-containing protein n=1 Tax=Ascaris lumbricoides TaxID=6252 RepID=A0A0M3IFS5_ASCLU
MHLRTFPSIFSSVISPYSLIFVHFSWHQIQFSLRFFLPFINRFYSIQNKLPYSIVVNNFVRQYFACIPISNDFLDEIIAYFENETNSECLINSVFAADIWIRFPEKRGSHSNTLKYLISKLESTDKVELCDGLYEAIARSMSTSAEYGHRICLSGSGRRFIVLKERNEQLSLGTTGLSCWKASCDLTHYLLGVGASFVQGRNVLELGAGCGLCGITLAASGLTNSVTLTYCNKHVLGLIEENLCNNFSQEVRQQRNIKVNYFDWMASKASDLYIRPNLIIASDVVYDNKVLPSLAHMIADPIEAGGRGDVRCLVASTVRNEDTMRAFLSAKEANGLKVDETFTFSDDAFRFEDGRCIVHPSMFPFVATLQCPTTFYWISSAGALT